MRFSAPRSTQWLESAISSRLAPGERRRGLAREGGYTLIELLIAMVLALVVLGATLDVIFVAFRDQTESGGRASATQLGSAMIERMTREIRQASQATVENAAGTAATTGGRLDLQTPVVTAPGTLSTTQHVVYDCTTIANECTRALGPVGGTLGTAYLVIDHVANGSTVFSGSNVAGTGVAYDPTLISLSLNQTLAAPLTQPLVLHDGVALRDLTP